MIVQVEVSLYPLGMPELGKTINAFIERLARPGLNAVKGNMSTIIEGELSEVFDALNEAFAHCAKDNAVVMVLKMSNACGAPQHGGA